MIKWIALLLLLFPIKVASQVDCYENKVHPLSTLSDEVKREYELKWQVAKADYDKDSNNADAIVWLGRRTAYLGNYKKAIQVYSRGLLLHPNDARLYRHRGHRYLSLRCIDKAIADFTSAAKLIRGKPDEVEPDGLPNIKNIPTSTLQSNIYYHLALCYFIKANYLQALKAYKKCLLLAKNADMYVATANWMNITLRQLNKNRAASKLCRRINAGEEIIENKDYLLLLDLYNNKPQPADIDSYARAITRNGKTVGSATLNFGIGYYCLLSGYREKAAAFFKQAVASGQWASFGFIAAEAELNKMQ